MANEVAVHCTRRAYCRAYRISAFKFPCKCIKGRNQIAGLCILWSTHDIIDAVADLENLKSDGFHSPSTTPHKKYSTGDHAVRYTNRQRQIIPGTPWITSSLKAVALRFIVGFLSIRFMCLRPRREATNIEKGHDTILRAALYQGLKSIVLIPEAPSH
jgi:hypothetical protein